MKYEELKDRAKSIANNDLLIKWANNSEDFSHDDYSLVMNNLRHWLAPTVKRLEAGLELLKDAQTDEQMAEVIHAFEHNIEDERGDGKETSHAYLFNKSAKRYGEVVYGKDIKFSKGIPLTMELKFTSDHLFKNDLYVMLGAALAQEIHALPQLELLLEGMKRNKNQFSDSDWQDVEYFYKIHLDGTEARHAEDLNQTIWSLIDTDEKIESFTKGFDGLLSYLDDFWGGLHEALSKEVACS